MTKRSLMYSAAFIGLIATANALAPQQAQAQKGVALQPSTQWAVSKVEASDGGNPYCAMARRFRPNTVLTFARNQGNEASFALDFQSPKFRQAEAMQVMLDPGAGQQRAFEVYPVSNQAFVIRLGSDEAFFGALEKTGFLRVEFGGKAYNFDLADIDVGHTKLASCIGVPVTPAAEEFTPEFSSEDSEYNQDMAAARKKLSSLGEQTRRMRAVPVESVTREDETDRSESIVVDQLTGQISALESENLELERKLKAIQSGDASSVRSQKDIESIERLIKENSDLRMALETRQAGDIQQEVLNDRIETLQQENARLQKMAESSAADDRSDADLVALNQQNENLKAELDKTATDLARAQDLQKLVTALQDENKNLRKGAIEQETAELDESRGQMEALKKENLRLQALVEEKEASGNAEAAVSELKGQIERLSGEIAAKEGKIAEMTKLSSEVQMLRTTNEELERQLVETALRGPSKAEALTQKVVGLETKNDALLQKIQAETNNVVSEDAKTIEALKAENESLKKTIAENQTLVETNKNLQAEMETLRQQNNELQAKANAPAAPGNPGGDLAAQLQKAQDDNRTLQAQLQQKEAELAELVSLREEVARLRAENQKLKEMAQQTPTPGTPPVAAPAAQNPEVETLSRENETLRSKVAGLEAKDSEINALKAELKQSTEKAAAAEESLKKAEAEAKAAQEKMKKQEAQQKEAKKKAKKEAEEQAAKEAKIAAAKQPDPAPVPVAAPAIAPPSEPAPVAIEPQPLSSSSIEQEMIRLEKKLGEAKAGGDQMEIQQAARDYMRLKNQMSAGQKVEAPAQADQAKSLLDFAGTAKVPVADVVAEDVTPAAPQEADQGTDKASLAAEDILAAGTGPSKKEIASEVNEAQKFERSMKEPPVKTPVKAEEGNISLRASEDPYAKIEVKDDAAADASYNARINETRAVTPQSVAAANDASKKILNEGKADLSSTDKKIPPPPSASWAEANPANATSASHGGLYKPAVDVPALLERAHVASSASAVSIVSSASGSDKLSYQWKADDVYGSSVQKPLSDPKRFDKEVQSYIEQTKKRCGNDFAVVPDESSQKGETRISTYEIACVGGGVSSSASLIFFSQNGTFTALAHETPTDKLDDAMEIRDNVLKQIGK